MRPALEDLCLVWRAGPQAAQTVAMGGCAAWPGLWGCEEGAEGRLRMKDSELLCSLEQSRTQAGCGGVSGAELRAVGLCSRGECSVEEKTGPVRKATAGVECAE